MKNQNLKVSFERLNKTKLQETVGGAWYSFITSCFTPKRVTPTQTYHLADGPVEAPVGKLPEAFAVT